MGIDEQIIYDALSNIRSSVDADGYELEVREFTAGMLRLVINARKGACEECLIAKPIMESILRAALDDIPGFEKRIQKITLVYPGEA
ncbi:MAG: hypothetical protein HYY45_09610 [Deltaproteobacteria bacterium]|nr:hypothetical protein [Deltaproteobacteria bacterium]